VLSYDAPTASENTNTLTFSTAQPQSTTSTEQDVTITNNGSAPLEITGYQLGGTDPGDYIVDNQCQVAVSVSSTCKIGVRFAPQGNSGSSSATLALFANTPTAPTVIDLSGTPSGAPIGATGPTGASGAAGAQGTAGANGAAGPAGPAGPTGASGAAGAQGTAGANGAAGPAGPTGTNGAAGAQGPTGANGAAGPAGATGPMGLPGPAGPATVLGCHHAHVTGDRYAVACLVTTMPLYVEHLHTTLTRGKLNLSSTATVDKGRDRAVIRLPRSLSAGDYTLTYSYRHGRRAVAERETVYIP
jgi:hypothetical protein